MAGRREEVEEVLEREVWDLVRATQEATEVQLRQLWRVVS